MQDYLLNKTVKINFGMLIGGLAGFIISYIAGMHEVIQMLCFTLFLIPFVVAGLTMSMTKFQSEADTTPWALKALIVTVCAIAGVFMASVIVSTWYIYLNDIVITAENRHDYILPGVYFFMLSITVIATGRFIARKTTNPLLILG